MSPPLTGAELRALVEAQLPGWQVVERPEAGPAAPRLEAPLPPMSELRRKFLGEAASTEEPCTASPETPGQVVWVRKGPLTRVVMVRGGQVVLQSG